MEQKLLLKKLSKFQIGIGVSVLVLVATSSYYVKCMYDEWKEWQDRYRRSYGHRND